MKKGFTLIELLAVIVILAIIALIATPIVLDIIEDSKNSSIKRSIELYADAVENSVAKAQLNGSIVPSGKYTTTDGKTLTNGETTIKVDYDGAKTVCDVVISNKGNIYLENCSVNDKNVEYTYGDVIYYNGKVVYFNVDTGEKCDNYTETQSNTGVKSGCMKFYAYNDDGGDKINLLLDHNTTATIAWNSSESNINGPSEEFLNKLNEDTKDWQGTEMPTNYSINLGEGKANYTIDYSAYKARLVTANEVAQITNNTSWDETTSTNWYYLDTNTKEKSTIGFRYGWLYDRTNVSCKDNGCLNNADSSMNGYGYWTVSSHVGHTNAAWLMSSFGNVSGSGIASSDYYGIRPVIEVLKSKL